MPLLLLLSDKGEVMMTETTKTSILAADIALVVQDAVKQKASNHMVIIETNPLVACDYVDPVDEQYKIDRKNRLGSFENRESDEGIASLHTLFSIAGDMPEY